MLDPPMLDPPPTLPVPIEEPVPMEEPVPTEPPVLPVVCAHPMPAPANQKLATHPAITTFDWRMISLPSIPLNMSSLALIRNRILPVPIVMPIFRHTFIIGISCSDCNGWTTGSQK